MAEHSDILSMEQITAILTDETANSPDEVFRRCRALEQLAASAPMGSMGRTPGSSS